MTTAFPLRDITKHKLQQLCSALWGRTSCPDCERVSGTSSGQRQNWQCPVPECCYSSQYQQQYERLNLFFEFYKLITSHYVPDFFDPEDQALRDHQDLFHIISLLRNHGDHLTREECQLMYFSQRCGADLKSDKNNTCSIPLADQERAFNLATAIMTMVQMTSLDDFSTPNFDITTSDPEQGVTTPLQDISSPFVWRPEQTLQDALIDAFPAQIHPSLQPGDAQAKTILSELTAVNLARIAKLRFIGTTDLRNHLKLDTVNGTVQIFHHTSFLKAHLLSSKRDIELRHQQHSANASRDISSFNSPLSGFHFPRHLALEVLSTLTILFPPPSHPQFHQNQSLLRSLVSKSHFDPDILRFGTTAYQLSSEQHQYPIFGHKLMALYTELEDPTPRGILDVWLEKRSKSRHVMLVTLAGVTVAIILGILSLAVSVFQAWISWQEWKHPT
ncbi:hypothetical protein V8F20_009568 [Naviculisporaceae sp. PSN 640]